jgi:DNA-directed RNA polymerase subunit RPC12/RpoP
MQEFECSDCGAEFEILHELDSVPEFCPFCGSKLEYDDSNLDEEDWYDDGTEQRGC